MSVQFSAFKFTNTAGIPVSVTVHAPATATTPAYGPTSVGSGSSTGPVTLNVNDCANAKVIAEDPTHGPASQTFSVSPPLYLRALEVTYSLFNFQAKVTAGTDRGPVLETPKRKAAVRKKPAARPVKKAKKRK